MFDVPQDRVNWPHSPVAQYQMSTMRDAKMRENLQRGFQVAHGDLAE
jgi:hypothetical protein